MIEDVAKALKKEIAATHRYFFDSVLEHKYSFKVSVLRVTLINELFDRIRDFKKGLKDIPALGRTTQGVRIMRTAEDDKVSSFGFVPKQQVDEEEIKEG